MCVVTVNCMSISDDDQDEWPSTMQRYPGVLGSEFLTCTGVVQGHARSAAFKHQFMVRAYVTDVPHDVASMGGICQR